MLTYEWTLAGISWQTSQGRMACRGDQHKYKLCSCLCCWFLLLIVCISLSYVGCLSPRQTVPWMRRRWMSWFTD